MSSFERLKMFRADLAEHRKAGPKEQQEGQSALMVDEYGSAGRRGRRGCGALDKSVGRMDCADEGTIIECDLASRRGPISCCRRHRRRHIGIRSSGILHEHGRGRGRGRSSRGGSGE